MDNNNFFGRRGRYQDRRFDFDNTGRRYGYRSRGISPILSIALILFVGFILFRVVGGILSFLGGVAPFLLIASLFINRRVFEEYFNFIKGLFEKNVVFGLVAAVTSVTIFLPLVSAYLFYRALTTRDNRVDKREDSFLPYEELSSTMDTEEVDDDDFLDLPPLETLTRDTNSSRKL